MFLGFDDSLKFLKKEFKEANVDMSMIRQWQKSYDKVKQQSVVLGNQYQTAKQELEQVLALLKDIEQQLIKGPVSKEALALFTKEMKKYQGHFNQEFLIGKEDTDFHSTYASILKLCDRDLSVNVNALILQSEVENLLAVTKEALGKNWPHFRAMAFFYIDRTDKDISDLPHLDKVVKVQGIYEEEFLRPFFNVVTGHLSEDRIKEIMEEDLWN